MRTCSSPLSQTVTFGLIASTCVAIYAQYTVNDMKICERLCTDKSSLNAFYLINRSYLLWVWRVRRPVAHSRNWKYKLRVKMHELFKWCEWELQCCWFCFVPVFYLPQYFEVMPSSMLFVFMIFASNILMLHYIITRIMTRWLMHFTVKE